MAFPEWLLPILIFAGSYFRAIFVFREIREIRNPRKKGFTVDAVHFSDNVTVNVPNLSHLVPVSPHVGQNLTPL